MVHLTRIYTKTGDTGTTSLGDLSRTSKTDSRIFALAAIDQANSTIGFVVSLGYEVNEEIVTVIQQVQNDLFDVGADLATPVTDQPKLRITDKHINYLEKMTDLFNETLEPLHSFVLPAGTPSSSLLHIARTSVRQAELRIWVAIEEHGDAINPLAVKYVNRLSDLLFVLARHENRSRGDVLWVPGSVR
jgi:cob(I)alamin adenosyltransferase